MAGTAAAIRVLEVVGKRPRIGLGEADRLEFLESVQAERSGSGFTIPTPCSRFVAAIASARAMMACDTSASGSARTIGSPSSAYAASFGSKVPTVIFGPGGPPVYCPDEHLSVEDIHEATKVYALFAALALTPSEAA